MDFLLEAQGLRKTYHRGRSGRAEAVRDVSFSLSYGTCLGLVGESGCGKSTLCRILAGLEQPTAGGVLYRGAPLTPGRVRGGIQMVFQNSLDSVNLHMDIFHIISEPLENLFHMRGEVSRREVSRLLEMVGISPGDMDKYPQQFSGGQLQRVCIARALAARPKLLLLDEPLSSLDVSVQAQILNLLADLKSALDLTCILVSHDLEAIYYLADALMVMYGGVIVEQLARIEDFSRLCHPYARRLLAAHDAAETAGDPLPPPARESGEGCPYHQRCVLRTARCRDQCPPLEERESGHKIACWNV